MTIGPTNELREFPDETEIEYRAKFTKKRKVEEKKEGEQALLWKTLHRFFRCIVFPASHLSKKHDLESSRKSFLKDKRHKKIKLTTPDNVILDGVLLLGEKRKVVLYLFGNLAWYENIDTPFHVDLFIEMKAHVLLVNPRGVGKSTGEASLEGFGFDVFTAFQYLIDHEKFKPEDIIIYGMSFGGASALLGAQLIQEQYSKIPLNIIHDRSFSNLSKVICHRLGGGAFGNFGSYLAKRVNWHVDCAALWTQIKGTKWIIYHRDDQIIPYQTSMHYATKEELDYPVEGAIELKESSTSRAKSRFAHSRAFRNEEREEVRNLLLSLWGHFDK
jgi:Chlamydia CHLPS protein (DUF818)